MTGDAELVLDLPDPEYRAWPGLSYSSAKTLMRRSPAAYRWDMDHGRPDRESFDIGNATHLDVLTAGRAVEVIDAADWRTKDARALRDKAREAGRVPILAADGERVKAAADALRSHPDAGPLLDLDGDVYTEVSIRWTDPEHGVPLKARLDLLREWEGRVTVVDVKTTDDASDDAFRKSVGDYCYHWQRASNVAALEALGVDDPRFLLAVVEKRPPHLVNVVELDGLTAAAGDAWWRAAVARYAACRRVDRWPGYPPGIRVLGLNPWHRADPPPVDHVVESLNTTEPAETTEEP